MILEIIVATLCVVTVVTHVDYGLLNLNVKNLERKTGILENEVLFLTHSKRSIDFV